MSLTLLKLARPRQQLEEAVVPLSVLPAGGNQSEANKALAPGCTHIAYAKTLSTPPQATANSELQTAYKLSSAVKTLSLQQHVGQRCVTEPFLLHKARKH